MSLLDEYSDEYTVINKAMVDKGALALASETEVKTAEAKGEKVTHTLLIDKSVSLDYHTVLRRSDGKIFRTTSKGDEMYTPNSSRLNKRKITCEEWEIPAGGE